MADEDAGEKRQTIWRKLVIIIPLAAGIAGLTYAMKLRKPPAQKPPAERAQSVRFIQVQRAAVHPAVVGYGAVKPGRIWNAITQISGKITYVNPKLKKGAIIQKDVVLARIDKEDILRSIAEAKANIEAAEAKLVELQTNQKNLESILIIEKKSLTLKDAQLKRLETLKSRGSATQASLDQEQRDKLTQERRVLDIENQLRLSPSQQSVQKAQIAVNKSRLATAELNLTRTEIVAPFTGIVAEANVERTQFAQAGSRLAIIDSIAVAEIEAQFPVEAMANFARAQADVRGVPARGRGNFAQAIKEGGYFAKVRLLSGPDTAQWHGNLVRISDTIDPQTRTVGIIIAVKDSYKLAEPGKRPPLTKGMFVRVTLHAKPLPAQILIPVSSIHEGKVYLANKQNRLSIAPVTLGLPVRDLVVVRKGLESGNRLVVSDMPFALKDMLLNPVRDTKLEKDIRTRATSAAQQKPEPGGDQINSDKPETNKPAGKAGERAQ